MIDIPRLTGHQARLLLEYLDNAKALMELSDDDYRQLWQAKFHLISVEVAEEFERRMPA